MQFNTGDFTLNCQYENGKLKGQAQATNAQQEVLEVQVEIEQAAFNSFTDAIGDHYSVSEKVIGNHKVGSPDPVNTPKRKQMPSVSVIPLTGNKSFETEWTFTRGESLLPDRERSLSPDREKSLAHNRVRSLSIRDRSLSPDIERSHSPDIETHSPDLERSLTSFKLDDPIPMDTNLELKGVILTGPKMDGKLHGEGLAEYPDGSYLTGDFRKGLLHGYGEIKFSNGSHLRGDFTDGLRHGQVTIVNAAKEIITGYYEQGQLISPVKFKIVQRQTGERRAENGLGLVAQNRLKFM